MMELKEYWKRFVASATGLRDKYWHDPFLKSELNVIVLQLLFAFCLFVIASIFFNYLYQDILTTITAGIAQSISTGHPVGAHIGYSLEIIKSNNFVGFFIITLVLTAVFTFFVAKITLRPAKNALSSQKRFISDIAHELRTPLSIIKTNSEVTMMDSKLDSKVRESIISNVEELDRMSEIINNLLSFSNLMRPEKMKFIGVDMGSIIDTIVAKFKALANKKGLRVIVEKITPFMVWGNPVALEQIVTNLLKNAINYTPDGGSISVKIRPDYIGNVILNIEDNGMGISKKDLLHIFEPFYRAERSRSRHLGSSSGLGLTIVSELVKLHSGRIIIKSSENKGTLVSVILPLNIDHVGEEKKVRGESNQVSINFLSNQSK